MGLPSAQCPFQKAHFMNRRSFLQCMGFITLGASSEIDACQLSSRDDAAITQKTVPVDLRLPSYIAGVRLVDSEIAKSATELSRSVSPPYLFNHAIRTYLFGSLVGRAMGWSFDEEILFLACVLHDLGLTEQFGGDLPFEIQGAEAAKHFLEIHSYSKERVDTVWDGIAMHPSPISQFKRPEVYLVAEGAAADVIGPDRAKISTAEVAAILHTFPRLGFKDSFLRTCADVVRRHPKAASRSFMRDIGERYVPEFHPHNFCDLVARAPFDE
jgi:hypothetical protein